MEKKIRRESKEPLNEERKLERRRNMKEQGIVRKKEK